MNGFQMLWSLLQQLFNDETLPVLCGLIAKVLAFVFMWSGIAKIRNPIQTSMSISDFGLMKGFNPLMG